MWEGGLPMASFKAFPICEKTINQGVIIQSVHCEKSTDNRNIRWQANLKFKLSVWLFN